MTIQEEIRKWIEDLGVSAFNLNWNESAYLADTVLQYIHDNGGVLKVKRELPTTTVKGIPSEVNWHDGFRHGQALMKQAGYVAVEPLIEESNFKEEGMMGDKAKQLEEDLGRIIYIQKHSPESWNNIMPIIKEAWVENARRYFKRHPELAIVDREAELPQIPKNKLTKWEQFRWQQCQESMLEAGYVAVESLVESKPNFKWDRSKIKKLEEENREWKLKKANDIE